ncbi:PspA/IM30 family protein [Corynebacterium propinquum]|uniref:PspA/IM30 family protein n=1 Tax=Corynebacterium propinquum TaxID=43769 RepID=UPI00254C6C0B|nr:PspA/IM30 family protein [Corynebacterium propinquum]MDK8535233.1 PspA/IM30 family protein [Corynebacterium propinquum]
MANPFSKAWNYFMALFDSKIDEHADPKVQIEQAISDAKRQHQELSQQAAAVIGNQRQLEMQLNRRLNEVEKLQSNTKQALELSDKARNEGDERKAIEYENAAEAFAAQLVTAEQSVEETKHMHDQALKQADQAKQAVERNNMQLQEKVQQRSKLLSQLEQAKMQEKVSESLNSMNNLTNDSSPSLDSVRDKIEQRYSRALGQAELAENSVQNRMHEVKQAGIQMAGHSRLEQIRAEMGGSGSAQKSVSQGQSGAPKQVTSGQQRGSQADQQAQPQVSEDEIAKRMRELRGE